jgi:hypothetical protein
MPAQVRDPVISQVMAEQSQTHPTRKAIFKKLARELERPVVSIFTSFRYPVILEDKDVDMLEGLLQTLNLENGLALIISSPGGEGLAAERVINLCRSYSGTGDYWAVVPSKAKSAATMLCFGASKVIMGPVSELGPVDPQLTMYEEGKAKWFSAYNVVKSYEKLFKRAVRASGNLQPFLQQLAHYDEREIEELRAGLALAEDISIRALKTGMMRRLARTRIKQQIRIFLTPEITKTHGRPIYRDEAASCGISVDSVEVNTELWRLIYELYLRTDNYVSTEVAKCIEAENFSFYAAVRKEYE